MFNNATAILLNLLSNNLSKSQMDILNIMLRNSNNGVCKLRNSDLVGLSGLSMLSVGKALQLMESKGVILRSVWYVKGTKGSVREILVLKSKLNFKGGK